MHLAFDSKELKPIDSYSGGIFRAGHAAYRGSILLLPDGVEPWRIAHVRQISFEALRPLCRMARQFDILVFGTGAELDMPPGAVVDALQQAGIRVEILPTAAACRTYNVLLAEGRAVAAALIAVK